MSTKIVAIQYVLPSDEPLYLVNFPYVSSGYYTHSGDKVESRTDITVSDLDKFELVTTNRIKTHFMDIETNILSLDDHAKKLQELRSNAEDSDDGYVFPDIDEEYAYKKFIQTWSAVYETKTETTPVTFDIIRRPKSEYGEIAPCNSCDGYDRLMKLVNDGMFLCKFMSRPVEYFWQIAKKYDIDKSRLDVPTHSALRFVKIDGHFIFNDYYDERNMVIGMTDTYEKCVDKRQQLIKLIDDRVRDYVFASRLKDTTIVSVGTVLSKLITIEDNIKLNFKKLDEAYNHNRANKANIRKLIDSIETSYADELNLNESNEKKL